MHFLKRFDFVDGVVVQTRFAKVLFVFAVCEIKFDLICFNFFLTYLAILNFSKIRINLSKCDMIGGFEGLFRIVAN